MPKVTVVIPCYNHGEFIEESIDSVLSQTYTDVEIIVVNDGSTDAATNEIIANLDKPKTTVITTANGGLPRARNTGIKAGSGEYILPLDADDLIAPTYIEQAVNILEGDADVRIVSCHYQAFGTENWVAAPVFDLKRELVENMIIATSMYRRADWDAVGGYKENMKFGWEDYDLWLSIIELGSTKVHIIEEVLFHYRKHTPNKTGRAYSLASIDKDKELYLRKQIMANHPELYRKNPDVYLEYVVEQKVTIQRLAHENKLLGEELSARSFRRLPFTFLRKLSQRLVPRQKN